jgi:hypothetical protein
VFFMEEFGTSHDPSRVCMLLGLIIQVNILACIPLFDGKPCFMLTMLILGLSLIFFLLRVRNSGNVVLIMLSFTSLLMFSLLLLGLTLLCFSCLPILLN